MSRGEPGHQWTAWCALLLSGVTFGASFSLFKIAAGSGQDALDLAFRYSAVSAMLVLVPLLAKRSWSWPNRRAFAFCAVWSVVSTTLPSVMLFHAARELPAGIVALAIAFVPMATFAGAVILKRDIATLRRCLGLGLGGVAALLVVVPETSLPDRNDVGWLLLPFGVVLCYAAEHLYYAVKAPEDVPAEGLLFLMFGCAGLTLLPFVLFTSAPLLPGWPLSVGEWALAGIALVTVLDYFLFVFLVNRAGPVFTSQAAYVVTLAGVGWGMLLFGESHSIWIWLALFLAMIGVSLVQPRQDGS
ncbi:MAG: DMT family transporter [Rhodobacter sp.]|nr:DMT family transporter [Rhodobacter sp.]MCY4167633.1 DMT family transporter [Rhodobacter sp.]